MHLSRKLFHASGVVIVLLYRGLPVERSTAGAVVGALALALGLADLLRALFPALQALFERIGGALLDPKDLRGLNGSTLYLSGCALTILLFRAQPACAGILALALGDSSAAVVGSLVRSPRWGRVSLAGSGACFAAAAIGALACGYGPFPALGGALAATALEAFSGSKLDNLTMPLGAALALSLLA